MASDPGRKPSPATRGRCLHELVFDQAARTPDRTAVRAGDGALSYAGLAARARRIAQHLRELGVERGTPVAILLPRSRNLPAAIMGVLAAGGYYVPLDPALPDARIGYLLDDSAASLVLTTTALSRRIADRKVPMVAIDAEPAFFLHAPAERGGPRGSPEDIAYLIYTSGSTGAPKGVMIAHRNATALIDWARSEYSATELSRVVAATSITFDLSVFEIFAPLSLGGSIDLVEDGLAFARWPERTKATLLNTVPSVARELVALDALPPELAVMNLAGEPLARDLVDDVRRACPRARVYNLYGPSEDTTYSTADIVQPNDAICTIGRPLPGKRLYLLDADTRPVAAGEIGEIFVAGAGVARGYLGRTDLTRNAFVPDLFGAAGDRMYRTGDLGRVLPDGRIQYLGRRDDQAKIRGTRIEPGEIEAVLRSHDQVIDAAVLALHHPARGTYLRCALVPRGGVDIAAIRGWAAERLPTSAVPSDWLVLPAFPRLPNGKLDRQALRTATARARVSEDQGPQGDIETRIARLWAELLDRDEVRRKDDFIASGGHSLLAMRLASRIEAAFGVTLSGGALLRAGTVQDQAELVRRARPATCAPVPSVPGSGESGPCSFAQERMWALNRLSPGSAAYNIPLAFRLRGPLDTDALEAALRRIAERHDILRTFYCDSGGALRQRVLPVTDVVMHRVTLSGRTDAAERANEEALAFAARSFDLSRQAPFAALLADIAVHDRLLVIVTHHIALDGSAELFLDMLGATYARVLAGEPCPPGRQGPTYIDHAAWQRRCAAEGVFDASLAYWRETLAAPPPPLPLPADRPRAPFPLGRGGRHELSLPGDFPERLARLGRASGASMFQTLLAMTWALLARLCDVEDICVAAPIADRAHRDMDAVLGNFVNTVILRGAMADDPTFVAILEQARARSNAAVEHGSVPLDLVVNAIPGLRHGGALSVNVMISLVDGSPRPAFQDIEAMPVPIPLPTSRFDLGFFFREQDGGLTLSLEYDGDRFDAGSAARLARCWTILATAVLADPALPLSRLPLLCADERRFMLEQWNHTERAFDETRLIHQLFEERARLQPDGIAVIGGGEFLSYAALDARAASLAAAIRCHGIEPGARVAVFCERKPHLVIAVLAVLKAGCAYVPLDPASPAERHAEMLRIAGAAALVSDAHFADRATALVAAEAAPLPVIYADSNREEARASSVPAVPLPETALAYVIFTSGTTGDPKAVAVRHRPVINLIEWVNRTCAVGPTDRLLFVTSIAFDLSVYDIFGTLAAGGSIRIANEDEIQDPGILAEILVDEPITFWDSAPVVLERCVPYLSGRHAPALRLAFLSGDWIPVALPEHVRAFATNAEVIALGGATEAVIWSNYHLAGPLQPGQTSIPYGRPIQNARYHILDRWLEPVPIGVPGDLYIGGKILADGYLGDPELTAARFIPDPFTPPGGRLYRTGDRARYLADGVIEFLGRLDGQVKIRGFRVETSGIEALLGMHEEVKAAHVAVRGSREHRSLCAYVVPERRDATLSSRLRNHLRRRLPEYMIPAAIVLLDAFPVTANGKLDRDRLPDPQSGIAPDFGHSPRTALENGIAEIWRRTLQIEEVGIHVNFFDAGGNSIRLIEVHRALEALVQRRVPVVALFRNATISSLAEALENPAELGNGQQGVAEARRAAGRRRLAARQRA